jgi:sugar phosphate isomerase/epimerase
LKDAFETDPDNVRAMLRDTEIVLALESHPLEQRAVGLLRKLDGGVIRTTLYTGWWGTVGEDPIRAIELLAPNIRYAHLKDVKYAGEHHDNCRWGEGIVPVRGAWEALVDLGFTGAITVEYEPDSGDPRPALASMRAELVGWQTDPADGGESL